MKFIVLGDPHHDTMAPRARVDDFEDTGYRKVAECISLAKEHQVDGVICTGDIFNRKDAYRVPYRFTKKLIALYDMFPCPVYVIPGNHDARDGNISTLDGQPFGMLLYKSSRLVTTTFGKPLVLADKTGNNVGLYMWSGMFYISAESFSLEPLLEAKDSWNILMTHADIYPDSYVLPYPVMRASQFDGKNIDILINGHIHDGLGLVKGEKMSYLNPGSLMRGVLREKELSRQVGVYLLELKKKPDFTCEFIPLKTMRPATEVFNMGMVEDKVRETDYQKFVDMLSKEANFASALDIDSAMKQLEGFGNVSPEILRMARVYLESVESSDEDRQGRYSGLY